MLADRVEVLNSPLNPDACQERLAERVTDPMFLPTLAPVTGWARDGQAHLRTTPRFRQDPVTVLEATFEASSDGTRIVCRTQAAPVDSMMTLFMGMVVGAVAIVMLTGLLGSFGLTMLGLQWLLLPFVGGVIGVGLLILRRGGAGSHHALLISFLADAVQARPVT